jgi:hypothetical protein
MTTKTRLNAITRRLEKLAPAEPILIKIVWYDDATGEEEVAGELLVDGERHRTINLKWPEELDDERMARQVAPGRA